MQAKPEQDMWMLLRKKAVTDLPEIRAHQAGAVFGPGLFIHGGLSGEKNKTLNDWCLFDFGLQVWMGCLVDEVFPDESQKPFTYGRKYHTLTTVVDPTLSNGRELSRLQWCCPVNELTRKPKVAE